MAKRADSAYTSGGRTPDWLKIKTAKRQEVVIAGFTAPRRTRPFFGALVLAVREGETWRYIGHVGTGFSHKVLEDLHAKLVKLAVSKSPFPAKVKDEAVTTWVKPSLVAEVKVRGVDEQGRTAPACLSRAPVRQTGEGCRARARTSAQIAVLRNWRMDRICIRLSAPNPSPLVEVSPPLHGVAVRTFARILHSPSSIRTGLWP